MRLEKGLDEMFPNPFLLLCVCPPLVAETIGSDSFFLIIPGCVFLLSCVFVR